MFLHNSGGQASEKHLHLRSVHEFFLVTRCRSSEWIAVKEPDEVTITRRPYYLLYEHIMVAQNSNS